MDQDAFRRTYHEVNERFCAYEKAVLTNQCGCSQSEKFCIAEREGVRCNSDEGQQRCLRYLEVLREQARFALRNLQQEQHNRLPHGKAIRIQVGGIRGLYQLLHPDESIPARIADIDGLLQSATKQFGRLETLPYNDIMPEVAAYRVKRRSRRQREENKN